MSRALDFLPVFVHVLLVRSKLFWNIEMEIKSSKYAAIKTLSYCTLLTADRDTQVVGPSQYFKMRLFSAKLIGGISNRMPETMILFCRLFKQILTGQISGFSVIYTNTFYHNALHIRRRWQSFPPFSPPPPPPPSAYLRNSLSFPQTFKDELSGVRMITHAQWPNFLALVGGEIFFPITHILH